MYLPPKKWQLVISSKNNAAFVKEKLIKLQKQQNGAKYNREDKKTPFETFYNV